MNKFLVGAIAVMAGMVLLLGGAGSFALWSATAPVNADSINSGTLTIDAVGTGTWTNITNTTAVTIDPATFKIVPGNKLQFKQSLVISATGDNLAATLTSNAPTVTGTITGLTSSLAVTSASSNVSIVGSDITVTNSATTATVDVFLTVDYPVGSTSGQVGIATFNELLFTLQQASPIN